jgi:hypothetical protein
MFLTSFVNSNGAFLFICFQLVLNKKNIFPLKNRNKDISASEEISTAFD